MLNLIVVAVALVVASPIIAIVALAKASGLRRQVLLLDQRITTPGARTASARGFTLPTDSLNRAGSAAEYDASGDPSSRSCAVVTSPSITSATSAAVARVGD
jgi:hypothetical protein